MTQHATNMHADKQLVNAVNHFNSQSNVCNIKI